MAPAIYLFISSRTFLYQVGTISYLPVKRREDDHGVDRDEGVGCVMTPQNLG